MTILDKAEISRECDVYVLSVNFTPHKPEPLLDIVVIYADFKVLDNLEWECVISTHLYMQDKDDTAKGRTIFTSALLPSRDKILREGLRLIYGKGYVLPGVD